MHLKSVSFLLGKKILLWYFDFWWNACKFWEKLCFLFITFTIWEHFILCRYIQKKTSWQLWIKLVPRGGPLYVMSCFPLKYIQIQIQEGFCGQINKTVIWWSAFAQILAMPYMVYMLLQTCRTLAEVRREANRRDELSKSAMVVIPKVAAFSAPALP